MAALTVALSVVVALTVVRVVSTRAPAVYEVGGFTMGTTFSVKIDADVRPARRAVTDATVARALERVDRLMSTYDANSEVSRLNRHEGATPFAVGPELVEVLTLAREVSERSRGAFDVTVAPLVEAWGFGPAQLRSRLPTPAELAAAGDRVGYERLRVDVERGTVTKASADVAVDLSGIAKGYAVDAVVDALAGLGYDRVLVEIGGELRAVGRKLDATAWRVGLERAEPGAPAVYATLGLTDRAIATSGDYRDFFERDGERYAHVVDPRSGRPIPSTGTAVSVVHGRAAVADAWATALTVLGPVAGYELAVEEGLAALFLTISDEGVRSVATPAFEARVEGFETAARRWP